LKILVTGAGGFVGSHLIRELHGAGHSVVATDWRTGIWEELPVESSHRVDLSDRGALDLLISRNQPDALIHLAGWSHVGRSWDSPSDVMEANIINTLHLYEAANQHLAEGTRFLFISSADVYGSPSPEDLPLNESSPVAPNSPYSVSKYAAEMALRTLRLRSQVELLIARPFNHIGPGQSPGFVLPNLARQIAEIEQGKREKLWHGNLESRRDFLDVRDVVRAYRLILEQGPDGGLFVIAGGESYRIQWLVERLFALAGMDPKMEVDPARIRPVDTPELRGDSRRLRDTTGWKPRYSVEETLREILEEARDAVRRQDS